MPARFSNLPKTFQTADGAEAFDLCKVVA